MAQDVTWRRIKWWGVTTLTQLVSPEKRWRWTWVQDGRKTIRCLVSPRGKIWRMKLARGAWIQPHPQPKMPSKKSSARSHLRAEVSGGTRESTCLTHQHLPN